MAEFCGLDVYSLTLEGIDRGGFGSAGGVSSLVVT